MPVWNSGLVTPMWITTSAPTATTTLYNPLSRFFSVREASTTSTTSNTIYWHTLTTVSRWYDEPDDLMQVYRDSLGNQYNVPSQGFVARAPTIIRPHDEREAAWRREIILQQAQFANERTAESQQRRAAASQRAHELLLEHLTPEQRDAFTKNGWFIVQGGRTGQRYRINGNRGLVGNVDVVGRNDRVTHRLCAHLDSQLPMGDQLVAQKLLLEFDEDHFLRTANRHAA